MSKHIAGSLDEVLDDDGVLAEVTAIAAKRVIAWQIAEAMKARGINKSDLAERMHTSRPQLNRVLDGADTGLTLETLSRAARALGCRLKIELAADSRV
jgi:DNA-binding Xre family transcriptional regulator